MQRMLSEHIKDYDVFVSGDYVVVTTDKAIVTKQDARGLCDFIAKAKLLRLGWGALPDSEVIYIYDKEDGNYGYAVNLQNPMCSEWGYAPFTS